MTLDLGLRGMPGIAHATGADHRIVFRQSSELFLAGGKVISGAASGDPLNTGFLRTLRPGLLMGKITASGKYAPCVIGTLAQAEAAAATSVTISAAAAVELVRRVGATGTVRFVGPPGAAGVVANFTETYSAVNTTTGVVTVSGLDAALIAGSFLAADDGTYLPMTFIPDGTGIRVTDNAGTDQDQPFPRMPVWGVVTPSQLIPWPTDTSLKTWVRENLSTVSKGKFTFDDLY